MGKIVDWPLKGAVEEKQPEVFGPFKLKNDGLSYQPDDKNGVTQEPIWICAPIRVEALARDMHQGNWGCLVRFSDYDNKEHLEILDMELVSCSTEECVRKLVANGLRISSAKNAKRLLCNFLQGLRIEKRARITNNTGWHGDTFVMPDRTIGQADEQFIYQGHGAINSPFSCCGSLERWREKVGLLCVGNSRLVLAVSIAFAAPLLPFINVESGGINIVGGSSTGKTTALRVAASVCGAPSYVLTWRGTGNGQEAVAKAHNNSLLILDELGQVDPREAGEIAYMLANGRGKTRATKLCSQKELAQWSLLFLSTGEIGLGEHMQAAGKQARAGQEVRLVDVPADAAARLGLFENLHGCASAAEFAEQLSDNASQNYGTPLIHFLEEAAATGYYVLSNDLKADCAQVLEQFPLAGASGQVRRGAMRFALIGAAGEYATRLNITGWEKGEAQRAAVTCFKAWLNVRGGSEQLEHRRFVEQLRNYIEKHGENKFSLLDRRSSVNIIDRSGFKSLDSETDSYEYFILPSAWTTEVCKGQNVTTMTAYLADNGYLQKSPKGHNSYNKRLPGFGKGKKIYHVLSTLFIDSEDLEDSAGNTGNAGNTGSDELDFPF